jgi:hypothetical protein
LSASQAPHVGQEMTPIIGLLFVPIGKFLGDSVHVC